MDIREDEPLWVERYRPQKVVDCILPINLKRTLQGYVDAGLIPNLIMSGGPGVGKTTAAKAMFAELDADYYYINGSMKGNIETLRTDVSDFASSVSFTGRRKYVLLDEADYLNANSTQPALRGFMEEFARNCGFILTCNYAARIIEPLHSRCGDTLEFVVPASEKEVMAYEFFTRVQQILKLEKVKAQPEVVAEIITRYFPDWRKVLNVLQNNVTDNKIDAGALVAVSDEEIRKLFGYLRSTNFSKVREWAAQNGSDHPKDLFRSMYGMAGEYLSPTGHAAIAIILNSKEYSAAFVANQEINLVAAMVEIMKECEFKDV
jgi:DNA polymerase III delta prime subunit